MSRNNEVYKEILNKIMEGKIRVFGVLAIRKVQHMEGLIVDNDGRVLSITGDPVSIISTLLRQFEGIVGKSSTLAARTAIVGIKSRYPDLELPPELQ